MTHKLTQQMDDLAPHVNCLLMDTVALSLHRSSTLASQ